MNKVNKESLRLWELVGEIESRKRRPEICGGEDLHF